MLSSMLTYTTRYRPRVDTASETFKELASALGSMTAQGDVLVVFGADWTSEIAYLANRRAVMLPSDSPSPDTVAAAVAGLNEYRIGAMVVCFDSVRPLVPEWASIVQVQPTPSVSADGCDIHLQVGG